ncbi:MAG: DUF2961 domain-containing protein [bacterium]
MNTPGHKPGIRHIAILSVAVSAVCVCMTSCGKADSRTVRASAGGAESPVGISWASILMDAADPDSLTRPPQSCARSLMFSSTVDTGKVCLAYLAPEIQGDGDHGFFLAVEDKAGGVEATLADIKGAGAITWMWSANPVGRVAVFIDGSETPALEMPFKDMLAGAFLPHKYPFASVTANGHNLSFPIVHGRSIKVVLRASNRKDLAGLFYQIAWNALDGSAAVHPFDGAEVGRSSALLGSIARRFTEAEVVERETSTRTNMAVTLPAGAECTILEPKAGGIVRFMDITAGSKQVLGDLWIRAWWDSGTTPAVDCPLRMLAGVSAKCEDNRSFTSTLKGSSISLRWPMPFGPGSRVVLRNNGGAAAGVEVKTGTVACDDTASLMRLNANFRSYGCLDLRKPNVLTLMEAYGCGRIVQCSIGVDSQSAKWWGEGDHIIWLDDANEPAWRGTGTEDYFGFAWCSDELFEHPFRSQTRADGSRTTHRVASMHRAHIIDTLPFHKSARFEMEAWGLGEGSMQYESSVIWYAMAATRLY